MRLDVLAIFLLVIIESLVLVWTSYDHSIPCWDTAAHKINSYHVFELLKHPHLRSIEWYRSIFAVSPLYPPFFYFLSAILKFFLGINANTELVVNLIFIVVLFYSVRYITKTIYQNRLASLIAPVLIFLYPAVFWSTHSALLDFPANAMIALGLAYFIYWNENPQLSRSIILGIVLGLALLTKNNTPIFFVGPLLVELLGLYSKKQHRINYSRLKHLSIVALVGLIVITPWLILAGPKVSKFISSIQAQNFQIHNYQSQNNIASSQLPILEFFSHFQLFSFVDLPLILSPLLFVCFLIALHTSKPWDKRKLYLLTSIIFALFTASAFRWPHQFRYIVPVTIPIAAITSKLFSELWTSKKITPRFLLGTIIVLSFVQFVYEDFSPFPIRLPTWMNISMNNIGERFKVRLCNPQNPGVSVNPLPDYDTGIMWSLEKIETASVGKSTSLMIMPNANPINCSPFYYLAEIRNNKIVIGSPREHTELGDKVNFDRTKALWYEWYLLKSGDQGLPLCDTDSSIAYSKWLNFVLHSHFFDLVESKSLPDGSSLGLYRRNTKQ